jgi:hypothetical protein
MAKKQDPKGDKIKRALPFKLTDAEKARKAEQAANLNQKLAEAVEKKKEAVSHHTAGIKNLQAQISERLRCIQDGTERREVQCIEVKNYEGNVVEFWFEGKMLESRPMTADDRQTTMKIVKPGVKSIKEITKGKTRLPYKDDDGDENPIAAVHRLETSKKTATTAVDPKP